MAENKNITMKQYNGTDYDVLYPKTKVSQVDGAVASVNNVTPDNTGAVKVDTFEQSIKIGKNVDVGTDGGASAVQFHFDGNANAYTSRIVESESGALTVDAILKLTQALGVEYGGTGATTAADAANSLINALPTGTSTPRDSDYYVSQDIASSTESPRYARRTMSALWSYIKGKIGLDSNGILPVSKGGTGKNNAGDAVEALFDVGPSGQNISAYPVAPGIYRTVGANIFSNLTAPHGNYGMLIIFRAGYGLHLYVDESGRFYWGRSGDTFGEPAQWYGQNTLAPDCYGTSLPPAGTQGRIFYKKV